MASKLHNLSEYDKDAMPDAALVAGMRFAIAVADWNSDVTFRLLDGAVNALLENGALETNIDIAHVPGAFELTYAANRFERTGRYDGVIVLGCVIQGDTPHFDYVCGGVTQGIAYLNAQESNAPVIFGVLTVNDKRQALERAGGCLGNKGTEAGITAIRMAALKF